MTQALPGAVEGWIETFSPRLELDLLPLLLGPDGQPGLGNPWGRRHRPDWHARGLLIWPRGGGLAQPHLSAPVPPGLG